jgi:eukaryotic-like serine/threonine-protein kinase
MILEAGHIVDGKYRIVRQLGEGGMGAVYEGENTRIHRRVAIKVLHATSAANAETVARFEREAQAAGLIRNDHILEVLDLGSMPDGDRYMVMEYLDGETLLDRIRRHGKLEPSYVVPVARQFLSALEAAHSAGIIHRDIKPENIFIVRKVGRPDFIKLIDFGLSRFGALEPESLKVTRTGAIIGTPGYMAPEQARGHVDARSDIYAAGVLLYEAVTGKLPFECTSLHDLLFKISVEAPTPPREHEPSLDEGLEAIILKAIATDPNQRYQTATELEEALEEWAIAHDVPLSLAPQKPRRGSGRRPASSEDAKDAGLPDLGKADEAEPVLEPTRKMPSAVMAPSLEHLVAQDPTEPDDAGSKEWARSLRSEGPRRPVLSRRVAAGIALGVTGAGIALLAALLSARAAVTQAPVALTPGESRLEPTTSAPTATLLPLTAPLAPDELLGKDAGETSASSSTEAR